MQLHHGVLRSATGMSHICSAASGAHIDAVITVVDSTATVLLQAMQVLKGQPQSQEFIYLKHADPNAVRYNPYNLEVVSHAAVSEGTFYTMSPQGVTQFVDGSVRDFTPLLYSRLYCDCDSVARPARRSSRAWIRGSGTTCCTPRLSS
jgi:hypothetical protein